MHRVVTLVAALLFPLGVAQAQEPDHPYPVSVGIGAGLLRFDEFHALALVEVTPTGWPVGIRLDGLWRSADNRENTDILSAASASAVITLRPWRVAPYLIVGATRTSSYDIPPRGSFPALHAPAITQLSGGLGFRSAVGRATFFVEMRELQNSGTPLTIGFTF